MFSIQEILLIISILPVILIGTYIYNKDNQKEPLKLLMKLFFGGIFSCFLVLLSSYILEIIFPFFDSDTSKLDLLQLIIYVFIGISLIEEFCKWIISYFLSYKSKEFDQFYDAILYCTFVALGFACFENLLYVYDGGVGVGIMRALTAVPGHVCDGIFMGYFFGLAKISEFNNRKDLKYKNLFLSITIPTIIHGIYDYLLISNRIIFILVFFVFIIILDILAIKKIKKISSINGKIFYKENYCPNCGSKINNVFCPKCGRRRE